MTEKIEKTVTLWSSLVKVAVMGTARQSPSGILAALRRSESAQYSSAALDRLIEMYDWSEPASAVLSTAGAIALYHQAGQGQQSISTPNPFQQSLCPDPASSQTRSSQPLCSTQLCSVQTAKHLRHSLSEDTRYCAELLQLLIEHDQRIPPEYLPTLLNVGQQQPELQPLIMVAIGARGRWLAAQNPEWHYAQWDWSALPPDSADRVADLPSNPLPSNPLPDSFRQLWQMGDIQARSRFLQRWRAIAPNSARRLLASTWFQEKKADRVFFLPLLATGLSLADEAFLEQALADRSRSVQTIAVHLLACIPQSQWCQRMTEWGRSLITIHHHPDLQIQVTLPERTTDHSGDQIVGLTQIIGSMPLQHWLPPISAESASAESVSAEPINLDQLLHATQSQENQTVLLKGWEIAAIRQCSQPWAEALLRFIYLRQMSGYTDAATMTQNVHKTEGVRDGAVALFHVLSLARREVLLQNAVPVTTRQQISLLSNTYSGSALGSDDDLGVLDSLDQGAADGHDMSLWLEWAVAIASSPQSSHLAHPAIATQDISTGAVEAEHQSWSLNFSCVVLIQLQRDISHQMPVYIRQVRRLAGAIANRLAPQLGDHPLLSRLEERIIPGPSHLQRSWDQAIEIMRSTLAFRQAMHAEFPRRK